MSRALRFLAILFALLCGALPARAAQDAALERGTAIIDPLALARTRPRPIWHRPHAAAGAIGEYPAHQQPAVRVAVDGCRSARRSTPSSTATSQGTKRACRTRSIGVGDSFDFQLFDRALLYSPDTRFVLAGIVNRMDRAYVDSASCGEIRLIYRLTRTDAPLTASNAVSPRLPMTLNVVLKAKGGRRVDRDGKAITCSEIAQPLACRR